LIAPVAGFLFDLQGSYLTILVVSLILGVIGLVAILMCTPPRHKSMSQTEAA